MVNACLVVLQEGPELVRVKSAATSCCRESHLSRLAKKRYLSRMDLLRRKQMKPARGFLDDQFLIAMPGMKDDRFSRAVIYVCAHSEEGAMGLMINQAQQMRFPDLLVQLGILNEQQAIRLPSKTRDFVVRNGGPVDRSRGFVLHSDDFTVESSMPVSDDICLTATVDILRAISAGRGPRKALMALGYSGWGAGQLESEIAANGWLTCPADANLLFDADIDRKYDRILATIGVDLAHLSHTAGHA
jgi:putative transcriptional regulator